LLNCAFASSDFWDGSSPETKPKVHGDDPGSEHPKGDQHLIHVRPNSRARRVRLRTGLRYAHKVNGDRTRMPLGDFRCELRDYPRQPRPIRMTGRQAVTPAPKVRKRIF
jgi:hypothetical protein